MFDVHCHILPGIDDGSKDVQMSLEMLKRESEQGIEGVVFTPHFYASHNSPEAFLRNRDEALKKLEASLIDLPKMPKYIVGSEVHYFRGMSRSDALESLCFGNSSFILIEMPFREWQPVYIDEIEEISTVLGLKVIIAHIERYFDQDKKLVKRLLDNPDLLLQCNAEFFIDKKTSSKAVKFLKKGRIDLLGSDSHNLDDRRPNIAEAMEIIKKHDRKGALDHINSLSQMVYNQAR